MKVLSAFVCCLIAVMQWQPAFCHDGQGGLSLEPPLSTRAISLGETGIIETDAADGFATNPSCLPFFGSPRIGLAHGNLIQGVSTPATGLSLVIPFGEAMTYPGYGDVARRYGLGLGLEHRSIKLARGTSWAINTISAGIGYALVPYASVGMLSKLLFSISDLDDAGVKAYGLDVGARLDVDPRLSLGLAVRNVVASVSWEAGATETPPVILGFGGMFTCPWAVTTEFAVTTSTEAARKVGIGVDVPLLETGFHLRAGYLFHLGDYRRNVLTAGFGVNRQPYRLTYGVRMDDEEAFGTTHRFSLGFELR